MPSTRVNHVRRQIILATGQARFEVTLTVTDPGDLPFPQVFVARIVDPLNPKDDVLARLASPREFASEGDVRYIKVDATDLKTISGDLFARVANVSEISAMPRDRTTAVREGRSEYLTSSVRLLYETITTADAAYRTFNDRLSNLVEEYRRYRDTFSTSPSRDYLLPLPLQSVEAEYTAAYRERKAETARLRDARDAAQVAYDGCEQRHEADRAILTFLVEDLATLERAKQRVTAMAETGTLVGGVYTTAPAIAFDAVVKTFVLNAGDAESYEAMLARKRAAYDTVRARLEAGEATCRALAAALAAAETTLVNAEREEARVLGDLLVVCPTFDPDSVVV